MGQECRPPGQARQEEQSTEQEGMAGGGRAGVQEFLTNARRTPRKTSVLQPQSRDMNFMEQPHVEAWSTWAEGLSSLPGPQRPMWARASRS